MSFYLIDNENINWDSKTLIFQPYKEGIRNFKCAYKIFTELQTQDSTKKNENIGRVIKHLAASALLCFPIVNIIGYLALRILNKDKRINLDGLRGSAFGGMPLDVLQLIFDKMDLTPLLKSTQVCKTWHHLIGNVMDSKNVKCMLDNIDVITPHLHKIKMTRFVQIEYWMSLSFNKDFQVMRLRAIDIEEVNFQSKEEKEKTTEKNKFFNLDMLVNVTEADVNKNYPFKIKNIEYPQAKEKTEEINKMSRLMCTLLNKDARVAACLVSLSVKEGGQKESWFQVMCNNFTLQNSSYLIKK